MESKYTWVPVHKQIAEKLLMYEDRQHELIELLKDIGIGSVDDRDKEGNVIELQEIDPFSFFFFLYKYRQDQNLKNLQKMAEYFNLEKPEDVDGIPATNAVNVKIFPYYYERNNNEVRRLWHFFKHAMGGEIDEEEYRDVLQIKSTAKTKLTQGLFLIRPDNYLPIDKQTTPYLRDELKINPNFKTIQDYFAMHKEVKEKDGRPFYEISHKAWEWNTNRKELNYWIFQGNPKKYDFATAFENQLLTDWTVTNHKDKVKPGDKVIIWISGKKAGCYALAEVTSEPYEPSTSHQDHLWLEAKKEALKADIEITHDLHKKPILKEEIDTIPDLQKLKVGLQGSNFKASKQEFETLRQIAEASSNEVSESKDQYATDSNNQPFNTILYGPPGTGKTYKLKSEYFQKFTKQDEVKSKKEYETEEIEKLSWWEVIALVLLKEGDQKVPQIRQHPYIQIKLNSTNNKNVNQVIWAMLQIHTSPEETNVKYGTRSEPFIFKKKENSVWSVLIEECEEKVPHLIDIKEELDSYKPETQQRQNFLFTTFHQSFSYEDFIEGIKPVLDEDTVQADSDSDIAFQIQKGIFYKAIDEAAKLAGFTNLQDCLNHDKDERDRAFNNADGFAIFIDEINRGNIASIFGELITLIEEDKRLTEEQETIVTLPYSKTKFAVPPNLHIIGTMNTADRSVEALDTALRRRFRFEEMPPQPEVIVNGSNGGKSEIQVGETAVNLADLLDTINARVEKLLDKDHRIGHSYFMNVKSTEDLQLVFQKQVVPLLEEYFYGDKGKIQLVLGKGFIIKEENNKVAFPQNDYEDAAIFEDRPVWVIREDWKNDPKELEHALQQLLGKQVS